ncbi:MAG TPA: 16S rRNA (cytidine(1402)-2'-O)-methyltransferase [Acidimicrobiales bacterium]|nr:16S rRNA (cytidine(1402)-2'-O)-methyltransferase [Acidimicrobiales bacterium]
MSPAAPPGGRLTVVATPIGNLGDLSPRAVETLRAADVIACEDTRHTRKLLSHAGIPTPRLLAVHDQNEAAQVRTVLALLEEGKHVVLVSDAGTPAVSDPGERLVAAASASGYLVEAVPGPSAVIAALVTSGLPSGRFAFEGFLPRKGTERRERLAGIAADRRTTVLYEAPHRLAATVADLSQACGPLRRVALARELTKLHEETWRGTLAAAVEHVGAHAPRGEYVIVVDGAPEAAPADYGDIEAALRTRLAAGDDRKTAVATVATALAVPKRRVYEVSLGMKERPGTA